MTLVDTSVWIGHLRQPDPMLADLLAEGGVLGHAFVTGEIACGTLRNRGTVLQALAELPQAAVAFHDEVLAFIDRHGLAGLGIGYVDAHLLAATRLTPGTRLWTLDRRLATAASRLGLGGLTP
ncbi:MAG: type II toxin-antitoxin system VapC family toxin [Acetobacteraceae bacterium]|nr:type II toxin-antitoxin system VapC family toxin [Acetobacteraceae bacterium]